MARSFRFDDSRCSACPEEKGYLQQRAAFSPLVTFWAFLSQVLSPNSACREAVRKVQAWWLLRSPLEMSSDTSAYCQARQRLSDQVLLDIHSHLAERMEANGSSESRWLSREVKIVDGTCLSMPDSPENQAAYPQPSNQKKGCGFPMMKLVGLFSLKSGALLHFARGTLRVHESQLFPATLGPSQRRRHRSGRPWFLLLLCHGFAAGPRRR